MVTKNTEKIVISGKDYELPITVCDYIIMLRKELNSLTRAFFIDQIKRLQKENEELKKELEKYDNPK
jgi:TATA-binding protein-associated factor Taf7